MKHQYMNFQASVLRVPGDAPIHELPERVLTEVPGEAPIHELPEKILTEVPNEAPVHELTELVVEAAHENVHSLR